MQDPTSMLSLGLAASLGVAAVTALWLTPCHAAPGAMVAAPDELPANLAELRARGPAGLDDLLARYDRAIQRHDATDPTAWDAAVDAVAGQRYAAASRLYWFTELDRAKLEARRLHRPILALRMLGDLRADLSCANSRLFRATLYANTEVAAFLREHFVLYWSSERPVPTVTIDFGDGRKLVRTTTGNSAHYVLDEDGDVLDVLPGLYAPSVFRTELTRSLALAGQVRGSSAAARARTIVAYHTAAIAAADRAWQLAGATSYIRGARYLVDSALARAQISTMSKMIMEAPDLRAIGALQPGELPADESAAWSAIGQRVWGIRARRAPSVAEARRGVPAAMVLDDASRTLIQQIANAGPVMHTEGEAFDAVIARLEQHIVADTALNQLRLRPAIHRWIVAHGETDFTTLNKWIYDELFATPSSDPWLGLLPRTDFTGLPGDGVVMR